MNIFDSKALTWDDLPRRVELAKSVVKNIIPHLNGNEKILDFGCGTGLVGLNLAPFVKEVIGIDTSKEMVKKFNEKSKKLNLNAKAFCKDIFEVDEKFDIVVSSMTLHHIKDIEKLSKKLLNLTHKVFLADLVKEDGTFHTKGNEGVFHFGFDKKELNHYFKDWKQEYKIIHTIKKNKKFPIFLLMLYK
ncbi:class I SAM-dependent methyltransferase [Caminibacter mediatlanticus TB-2]|uniref:Class I SAM-dependent methyltransferase n=1 Tax=Caminibacter mediatlanticus TB-2 TaxID=391592 RepID=A0ABX5VAF0_9BACT|nr:class I SAM-dependent methyltransferase [Caminibacter mediatlanticus]QCT95243.1 class I SAM-dependent methyltransferase [Caminibacter mediatlanticus TB-2]